MEMEEGNRSSRRNSPVRCGCNCGWFKTRLTQDQDLIVYQQPLRHIRGKAKTADFGKNTVVSAIVIQNKDGNQSSVRTEAFLPKIDVNEINCPRCRNHIQRARALLKNVFVVKNNNICVCEMCDLQRLTHVPCLHCENVKKQLKLSEFFVPRKKHLLKQQEQIILKTFLRRRKMEKQTKDFIAYSDIHLANTFESNNRHNERVQRSKSAIDLKNEPEVKDFASEEEKTFKYIFPSCPEDEKLMFEISTKELKDIRKRFHEEVEKNRRKKENFKIKNEIKYMIEWATQIGISLSDLDISTEKYTRSMTERERQKEKALTDMNIMTTKNQNKNDFRTKTTDKIKDDENLLREKERLLRTVKYDIRTGRLIEKRKDGKNIFDERGRLIKKDKNYKQGIIRQDKKDEQKELRDKDYDKELKETDFKKTDKNKAHKKVKKERKSKAEREKKKEKRDKIKQKGGKNKIETKISEVKENLQENIAKVKGKHQKVSEDEERQKSTADNKKTENISLSHRGKENIKEKKTAGDKEKKNNVKDATKFKKAPETDDKSTGMYHIDSNFDIPSIDENLDKKTKKAAPIEGVDEIKLLNEVIQRQKEYIAAGLKAKKAKEDKLRLQQLKAEQTIKETTEPHESLQYIVPGANKVEKIDKTGGDRKKAVDDNNNMKIIPLHKIKIITEA